MFERRRNRSWFTPTCLAHILLLALSSAVHAADPPPESVALVVNGMDRLDPWEQLTFSCLQGIANRDHPSIYLIRDGANDRLWLDWYIEQYGLKTRELASPYDLFDYQWPIDGYCVVDPKSKHTGNLAANYASTQNLLPVTQQMLTERERLPALNIKVDLRDLSGNWNAAEAYRWAYENQWRKLDFNRSVSGVTMAPDEALSLFWKRQHIRDYIVAKRGFMFELSADPSHRKEYELRDKYLSEMDDWGYLMGWHVDRDKEPQHVAQATKHHQLVLCSNTSPNFSFHQHIKPGRQSYRQRKADRQSGLVVVEPDQVYLTFYFSDGDSLNWLCRGAHGGRWLNRGVIPMGWEIQPLLVDLAPGMLDYFYRTATENDVLVASASGIGYNHPETLTPSRLRQYLAKSKPYLQKLGLETLVVLTSPKSRQHGVPDSTVAVYRDELGETLLGVFESYTAVDRDPECSPEFVWMPTRLPYSSINRRKPAGAYADAKKMIEANDLGPLFLSFHVNKGHMSYRQAVEMTKKLKQEFPDQIVVTTPDRFLRLYQSHCAVTDANAPTP